MQCPSTGNGRSPYLPWAEGTTEGAVTGTRREYLSKQRVGGCLIGAVALDGKMPPACGDPAEKELGE